MKKVFAPLLISAVALASLAFLPKEVKSVSAASSVPTDIDLNDCTETEIRDYYKGLNSLGDSERQGTNLLKNLKPILKTNQQTYNYDGSTGEVWKIYEISDRDWSLSPAKDIDGYNASTNKISGYKYGTSVSNKGSNPYVHALYVNRNIENKTTAWDTHEQGDIWGINREHVWPKALGFDDKNHPDGARGDLMHLIAGNGYANNLHSNYYYGYVDKTKDYKDAGNEKNKKDEQYSNVGGNLLGKSKTLGGTTSVFEPQDSDKGDIARAIFYMAARYNFYSGNDDDGIDSFNPNLEIVNDVTSYSSKGYTSSTTSTGKNGILQDLLEWNKLDPVDSYEIHRNNLLFRNYSFNRNPFIDFPDWADCIWGTSSNGTYDPTTKGVANPLTDKISEGTETPVTPSNPDQSSDSGIDWKVVGIVAGISIVIIIILIIIFVSLSKRNKKKVLKVVKKSAKKSIKKSSSKK